MNPVWSLLCSTEPHTVTNYKNSIKTFSVGITVTKFYHIKLHRNIVISDQFFKKFSNIDFRIEYRTRMFSLETGFYTDFPFTLAVIYHSGGKSFWNDFAFIFNLQQTTECWILMMEKFTFLSVCFRCMHPFTYVQLCIHCWFKMECIHWDNRTHIYIMHFDRKKDMVFFVQIE